MQKKDSDNIDFSMIVASSIHDLKNNINLLTHCAQDIHKTLAGLPDDLLSNEEKNRGLDFLSLSNTLSNELSMIASFYKMQKEHYHATLHEHWVADLAQEQGSRLQYRLQPLGAELLIEADDDLVWFFDEVLMSIALYNALTNASKACKKTVLLIAKKNDGMLEFAIHDDGPGFPDIWLENFSSSPSEVSLLAQKSGFEGTGLGIYFMAKACTAHQNMGKTGRVLIEKSDRLGGACVRMLLP